MEFHDGVKRNIPQASRVRGIFMFLLSEMKIFKSKYIYTDEAFKKRH